MNNATKTSSPAEDLAYIRRIMEDSRYTVTRNGSGFIIWGILILLGLLGEWLLSRADLPGWSGGILWAAIMVAGWSLTVMIIRKHHRGRRPGNPAGRLMGGIWLGCSIALVVIFFVGIPTGIVPPAATGGLSTAVIGIGVFLTGILMGTPWVRNLAFGWWLGSVAAFIWHGEIALMIVALVIVVFYLIPGFVINAQARRGATDQ